VKNVLRLLGCSFILAASAPAWAEQHVISAQATAYAPLVLFIQPGDSVRWSNMLGHDAQTIEGLIPEGAEGFHIPLGEDGAYTFEQEGVYVYKCNPHFALGMAGSIIVGEPHNLAEVEANAKGMAKRVVVKTKKAIAKRVADEQGGARPQGVAAQTP